MALQINLNRTSGAFVWRAVAPFEFSSALIECRKCRKVVAAYADAGGKLLACEVREKKKIAGDNELSWGGEIRNVPFSASGGKCRDVVSVGAINGVLLIGREERSS